MSRLYWSNFPAANSPRGHQYFVQLVDDRRFADSGIARDQHQLRRAALDDAVEGSEQDLDLVRASVQLFGDQQPVGRIVFAQHEHVDAPLGLELRQTAFKIALQTGRGLVTLLSR